MTQTRYRSSLDYLTLAIEGPSVDEVESDVFQVCFSKSIRCPINPVWYNAQNNGDGTISILEGPAGSPPIVTTLTAGCWFIQVKVSDNPTIPIFFGGTFYVLD